MTLAAALLWIGALAATGQVVLYDGSGQLERARGITGARGQEGEGAGGRGLLALMAGSPGDSPASCGLPEAGW